MGGSFYTVRDTPIANPAGARRGQLRHLTDKGTMRGSETQSRGAGKGKGRAQLASQTPQLVNSGTSGQLLHCLYTPWEGPRDNSVARRCRLPARTFTWLGCEEGWDRQGLNKEASGVWGAIDHLLPPLGHEARMVWRPPRCACPSAMCPSLRGRPRPRPRPHRWGRLGRGQLFASEGMAGGGCSWAPM